MNVAEYLNYIRAMCQVRRGLAEKVMEEAGIFGNSRQQGKIDAYTEIIREIDLIEGELTPTPTQGEVHGKTDGNNATSGNA